MSKWQEYKNKIGTVRPWDVLNPDTKWSTDELFEKRIKICFDCDRLLKITTQCKECGCFMKLKARMQEAKCPLNKW